MSFKFKLPELGEGLAEGVISTWDVKEGDTVEQDQTLVEIENDKSVVELPSPVAGTIKSIKFKEGDTVEVGQVIVDIDDGSPDEPDDEAPAAPEAAAPAAAEPPAPAQPAAAAPAPAAAAAPAPAAAPRPEGAPVLAMPSVRRYAREHGIDLSTVTPTGSHGHVLRADVDAVLGNAPQPQAAAPTAPAAATEEQHPEAASAAEVEHHGTGEHRVPFKGIRKATAKAVTAAHEIPPVTFFGEAEVTALLAHRKAYKQLAVDRGIHLTPLAYIVKALVAVLKQFPDLNTRLDLEAGEIVYRDRIDVGIATDTERGLFVPVVRDADRLSLLEIAEQISANTEKAKAGKLGPSDMGDASITISNVGSVGGGWFTPILNAPETAILGVGRAKPGPIVNPEGELEVGQLLKLSFTTDHRIIDGAQAQQALNLLVDVLADPARLLIEA